MTNNSKQEKTQKTSKSPEQRIERTLDEKARPSSTASNSKFWIYGLLTLIITLGSLYVISNSSFDTINISNKFEKTWNTGLNLLRSAEEKPIDNSIVKNIDQVETVQPNASDTETNASDLEKKIMILQEKLVSLDERFRSLDNANTNTGSKVVLKAYSNLEELLQSQKNLEKFLTKLADRVDSLEREKRTRLASIADLQKVVAQQEKNVSIISDRLTSNIESLKVPDITKKDRTLQSPMIIFSLGHLLTTIRQERPFTIQLQTLRLNSAGKLEIEEYINRLEKYAATGIPNLPSLLKELELIKGNQLNHEGKKVDGMLGGILSQVKSLVKIRKTASSDPKPIPIAIDAAIEALRVGDLNLAIGYIKKLDLSLANELKDWLKKAESLSILETIVPELEGLVLAKLFKSE
ncbi:hypothetical protein OAI47_02345 [Rhodospirillaceae bacterium]|nr:hypothetical protein [Rhodospirillaceae bacterium]